MNRLASSKTNLSGAGKSKKLNYHQTSNCSYLFDCNAVFLFTSKISFVVSPKRGTDFAFFTSPKIPLIPFLCLPNTSRNRWQWCNLLMDHRKRGPWTGNPFRSNSVAFGVFFRRFFGGFQWSVWWLKIFSVSEPSEAVTG